MNQLPENVCHIESGGIAFGRGSKHLRTANRAIIVRDCSTIKIKMDGRGSAPVRKRNRSGGFVVGCSDDARSTGRIGQHCRFEVKNGWIHIKMEEVL